MKWQAKVTVDGFRSDTTQEKRIPAILTLLWVINQLFLLKKSWNPSEQLLKNIKVMLAAVKKANIMLGIIRKEANTTEKDDNGHI